MWNTALGDRTLRGAEALLIRDMVGYVHDMITSAIEIGEPVVTDVAVFNALQTTQQMSVLFDVAKGLLVENEPPLELTAVREATIYVLYREILGLIEIELDLAMMENASDRLMRSKVAAAMQHVGIISQEFGCESPAENEIPIPESTDRDEWESAVEFLAGQILWDRDFELEALLADRDPESANFLKQFLGISDEYFPSVAADPDSETFQRLHLALHELTAK